MQVESLKSLNAFTQSVGPLPILDAYWQRLDLQTLLGRALPASYVRAIQLLLQSLLLRPSALYRLGEWSQLWDPRWIAQVGVSDDALGRALDRLFEADRASLLTLLVLKAVKEFDLKLEQIHNDSTTISFAGAYQTQNQQAVQLRRGHSKNHRPDLKQLVYSLSVSADGAVPVHYKAYDGNRNDESTHWETWQRLRQIFGHPDFLYVADCKLCVRQVLLQIDAQKGRFITTLTNTRSEPESFQKECLACLVRWEPLWKRRCPRPPKRTEVFELASGFYQVREGFRLYWYRSSEKIRRDEEDRQERLSRALRQLDKLRQGRRSEKAMAKAAQKIMSHNRVQGWIVWEIEMVADKTFKQNPRTPGQPVTFKKITKKLPQLTFRVNPEAIAQAKTMDGVFPLTTNTELAPLDALKKYKYQPFLEKRHSLFKTTLEVAPVFLKKNTRIEAILFVSFLAQLTTALMERTVRQNMARRGIKALPILPEGRESKTPTVEQIFGQFAACQLISITDENKLLKAIRKPLNPLQQLLLELLNVDPKHFE
jgi:transposase